MLIYTLIDITETKQYRGADKKLTHQQANFMTFFQTLCLRQNYLFDNPPEKVEMSECLQDPIFIKEFLYLYFAPKA